MAPDCFEIFAVTIAKFSFQQICASEFLLRIPSRVQVMGSARSVQVMDFLPSQSNYTVQSVWKTSPLST
ncbi:hypothetical protein MPTK1_2g06780 [Marchantia polymorpha subsp. ruderalis]|uniref:Uncharacterized protein n=1 Tax=Marchantia polymorpha TaxID=3197 RepID=A0A2R6XDU3_MARPO|nr:hypothetical protein MARPO_0021s0131 [Marchantia polymorpha]BBN01351.1 hypothetical protein Mp_2g06780 [Marchantia polymorpha subsp. ruderalis]|eukprot:PTQ44277.1 hypothetical protein MARPO_0021s0131 [Marchantia polymorpha]